MGPRVFTRGNVVEGRQRQGVDERFNGATRLHAWKLGTVYGGDEAEEVLQWGHASSRVETALAEKQSELERELQWGHASSRVETWQEPHKYEPAKSFNGATRLHAWKQRGSDRVMHRSSASMGPRVFTRGNLSLRSHVSLSTHRFNGATRLHAWKRRQSGLAVPTELLLQWGHASSRVETLAG